MTTDVYIKLTSGRVFHKAVPDEETVRALCEQVATEEGVSANCLRLKYTGKVLNKDHTVTYLGVRPETILKVDILQVKSLTICIKCESGNTIPLTIQNTTTLKEIISKIRDQQGQASSAVDLKLKLKGKSLSGDQRLAEDLGIDDEAVLDLEEHAAAASGYEEEEHVQEELDQSALDELLANFADGLEKDKNIEVVFSFDTTGSMYGALTEVRDKLDSTVSRLLRDIPNIRIGIMSHGDFGDQHIYVLRSVDLTSDSDVLLRYINDVPRTGGQGPYACYEWVLHKAQELSWSEDAAKALVIIGDVKPHAVSFTDQKINWHTELDNLCQKGVKVYGVHVYNDTESENFYREISEKSGGVYLKFQHFNFLTDMFLAVCYHEAGEEQLQQYVEEVKQEGRMTEELTDMFQQLEEKPAAAETNNDENKAADNGGAEGRYVNAPWWDPKLDHGNKVYRYSAKDNYWSSVYDSGSFTETRSKLRRSLRIKRRNGKSCTVM